MAAKKKSARKKTVVKSAVLSKKIESAIAALTEASEAGAKAIDVRGKEVKKLATAAKRLSKKRATLLKRKKTASNKLKSAPGVETRKALNAVVKELTAVSKQAPKARAVKAAAAAELAGLKSASKRVTAYVKSLEKADKLLNKPAKKRKKRRKAPAA